MDEPLNIALACGGTGGHIFPGLATADALQGDGHLVTLWLAGKDIETPAVKKWKSPIVTVRAEGLPSGFSLRAVHRMFNLVKAGASCRRLMASRKPDVVLAMGSYASAGPVSAALMLGLPVVLHEANVLPGRAVALFAKWATTVAGSFEETRFYLRRKDLVLTGMPIRAELEKAADHFVFDPSAQEDFTVLVMGGSLGAHRLNEIVSAAICEVFSRDVGIRVIHLTGVADEQAIKEIYERAGVPHTVSAFCGDMASVYTKTHLAICRSGAATCAEICAFGVSSLMVPYPFATHDHQMANARAMERAGAADVVPERDLSESWLSDYLAGCMQKPERLARIRANARDRVQRSGARQLADLVVQTARAHKKTFH
ncbi:MAG: undecaprenyldiphospho-muramoylpentapeptide beta-N-acetylglucosaminyltransferase [Lentisphaerota bacterium]